MLEIYIFDHSETRARSLWQLCREKLAKREWEMDVLPCYTCPQELAEAAGRCVDMGLFLMELLPENAIGAAVREIHAQNENNYLILALNRVEELLKLTRPYYRPSGYLLQPVSPDDLDRTLLEVYRDYRRQVEQSGESFSFKVKAQEFRIPYRKILYFESSNKKIIAHTATQEFEFSGSLEQISESAPAPFMRIHKSFCANLSQISQVNYAQLSATMTDGSVVFLSRTYKAAFQAVFSALGEGKERVG